MRSNADLTAAQARAAHPTAQRPTATPVISGFSPAAVTAGTSNVSATSANGVLTLNGTGFNATRGTGYVLFRSADNPATSTQPLPSSYLLWNDTQIQVRVPSASASGNTAGTGPVMVVNSDGNVSTAVNLTVTYAITNVTSSNQNYRIHLVGTNETGNPSGYVLHYAASLPTAAQAPFEAALASWRCQAGANRTVGAVATQGDVVDGNDENVVRFGILSAGVLGVTNSYFSGCVVSGILNWELTETDYTFSSTANWYYGTGTPTATQSDFQSVSLHELGHGIHLGHIISSTGVMNYALTTGTTRRTLDSSTDLAAAADETAFSTGASVAQRCGEAAYVAAGPCALPVQLVQFTAQASGPAAVALAWATASEANSARFEVERSPDGVQYQKVSAVAAAGSSSRVRAYGYLDQGMPAGTWYYRLRQVDIDGTASYSPVRAVLLSTPAGLVLFPNPAIGTATLMGTLPGTLVRVLDTLGREVSSASADAAGTAALVLPPGLSRGVYIVRAGPTALRLTVE